MLKIMTLHGKGALKGRIQSAAKPQTHGRQIEEKARRKEEERDFIDKRCQKT